MRYIGLLDCNNFFVSCERLFRPDLRTRPVVVLSSNDGCIVARSQEVKDMDVPMGVPYFQVKDSLRKANTTVFSSHFALYRDISRRIFNELRQVVGTVEQYSIDESFFWLRTDPETEACRIRQHIERVVGVPVSIGVAASKTQAKYANTIAKRTTGVAWFTPEEFIAQAGDVPLATLWGVGAGRSRAFTAAGLQTVRDLVQAPVAMIQDRFGVQGARLQQELRGVSVYPITSQRAPQQSVMSSRSFARTTTDLAVVQDALAYHVRHAVADIRAQGQCALVVQVSLRPSRHGAFALRGGSTERVLETGTNDTLAILQIAQELLHALWQANVPYQKVGICLRGLTSTTVTQGQLFTPTPTALVRGSAQLWRTIDAVNQRWGNEQLRLGSHGREAVWQSKRDKLSPAYTTRWCDVPTVRA